MIVFKKEKGAVFPVELALVWEGIVQGGWWNSPSGIGADTEIPNESIFLKTCHTQSEKGRQPVYEYGIYVTFRQKISISISSFTIYILSIRYWKNISYFSWFYRHSETLRGPQKGLSRPKRALLFLVFTVRVWNQKANTSDWYMFHSPTKRSSANLEKKY